MSDDELIEVKSASSLDVFEVRGDAVVIDSDLAAIFGIETRRLNEQVKRNAAKFAHGYAFQLEDQEWADLKSQSATPSRHGGRRTPPWVFTEHGVVMAATVLNSEPAVRAARHVVEAFVAARRRSVGRIPSANEQEAPGAGGRPGPGAAALSDPRLQRMLEDVLETVVEPSRTKAVQQEAKAVIALSIESLKDRLKKPGVENQELAAHAAKLLAEAEKEKSIAAKTRAEAEQIQFSTLVKKLKLLIEADATIARGDVGGFLSVLDDLDS